MGDRQVVGQVIGRESHPDLERYVDAPTGTRVVLAEDDPELRGLLRGALEKAGFTTLAARDGREVLAMFAVIANKTIPPPDAIVLDVRMPSHSGLELLVALKRAEWDIPVVLMSGFADALLRARAEAHGAFEVLEKPLGAARLVSAVERAIRSTGA